MPFLQQRDLDLVRDRFATDLKREVSVRLITQSSSGLIIPGRDCRTCTATEQMLKELAAATDKIKLEVIDFYANQAEAQSLGVDKIPAVIVGQDGNANARFYGLPSGFECAVLLDSLVFASARRSRLQLETRRSLRNLKEDVHIQVFVTPT